MKKKLLILFSMMLACIPIVLCMLNITLGFIYPTEPAPTAKISPIGLSQDLKIVDAFPCAGPDENGIPADTKKTFATDEWESIFICAYITTSEPSSIHAEWRVRDRPPFVLGPTQYIYEDGYLYFSLRQAVATTTYVSNSLQNYLYDDIKQGYLPPGQYYVMIKKGRNEVADIKFTVETKN